MTDIDSLVAQLEVYNRAYREGQPLISDDTYDRLVEQLRLLDPGHPFLHSVEPEQFASRVEIRHATPMLSIEKVYIEKKEDYARLERFIQNAEKSGREIGITQLRFRATVKLDGLAGRDDGNLFATRGNGIVGYEISNAFDKGVIPIGGRGQGLGEIVVVQSYFDEHMADKFEHPRNMVVGIISSDTLNPNAKTALDDGMVHFLPYSQLPDWQGSGADLLKDIDAISDGLMEDTDYPLDGVVVEVIDPRLREYLGATAHHYRWQIAVKRKGETAETLVRNIQWQVGRTGHITPVLEVDPVTLSGATIRRVTAHHASRVAEEGMGPGALIEIIRSGEVIPKIEHVLKRSDRVELPSVCPRCAQPLTWETRGRTDNGIQFLFCRNSVCPGKTEEQICHWFKTLGNADWFGIKTVQKLVEAGYDSLEKIYAMGSADFQTLGFGPVLSENLANALTGSRTRALEDWRFLAAFGIDRLGLGDSRKLLSHIPLEDILHLERGGLETIKGFGELKSEAIISSITSVALTFEHMLALGFNLEKTPLVSDAASIESPIAGKKIVFTGKMIRGNREEMQAQARQLGAQVQSSVSGATDMLVCGEKVGQSKMDKASRLGVQVLSEEAYFAMIEKG